MREGVTHLGRKMTSRFTERHLLITRSCKQMSTDTYISGKKVIKVIETLINMVSWPYRWDLAGEKIDFLTKIIPSDQFNLIWTFQSGFTHSQPTFALGIWLWRGRPSVGRGKHRIPSALSPCRLNRCHQGPCDHKCRRELENEGLPLSKGLVRNLIPECSFGRKQNPSISVPYYKNYSTQDKIQ